MVLPDTKEVVDENIGIGDEPGSESSSVGVRRPTDDWVRSLQFQRGSPSDGAGIECSVKIVGLRCRNRSP
jgi:hypothetical protein